MTNIEKEQIIKLRFAVYRLGIRCNWWADLDVNAAKEYMDFLFPKSATAAYYTLMLEVCRKKHIDMIPLGKYGLFKFPEQIEEVLLDYIKNHPNLQNEEDEVRYIESLATISSDTALGAVSIGRLDDIGIDPATRLMAFHYGKAYEDDTLSYPYFE